MNARGFMKLSKTDKCIVVQTVRVDGSDRKIVKSSHFYIAKPEFEELLNTGRVVSKDIYSFMLAHYDRELNRIEFEFSWLESNGFTLSGKIERTCIKADEVIRWLSSNKEELSVILASESRNGRIVVNAGKTIKAILGNKIVKRKFIKAISSISISNGRSYWFSDDFSDFSLYFVVRNSIGEMCYNGGLIFHKDYKEPENLSKGYYSMHT